MKVKVKGNLSGAVRAIKDQVITVNATEGQSLIERGLATEVIEPRPAKPKAVESKE